MDSAVYPVSRKAASPGYGKARNRSLSVIPGHEKNEVRPSFLAILPDINYIFIGKIYLMGIINTPYILHLTLRKSKNNKNKHGIDFIEAQAL